MISLNQITVILPALAVIILWRWTSTPNFSDAKLKTYDSRTETNLAFAILFAVSAGSFWGPGLIWIATSALVYFIYGCRSGRFDHGFWSKNRNRMIVGIITLTIACALYGANLHPSYLSFLAAAGIYNRWRSVEKSRLNLLVDDFVAIRSKLQSHSAKVDFEERHAA